jgi:hypothetical protein
MDSETTLRNGATKRLRTIVEPILKEKATDIIPIMELNADARSTLASVVLANAMPLLRTRLSKQLPAYLQYEDSLVLRGSMTPPKDASDGSGGYSIKLALYYKDADGNIRSAGAGHREEPAQQPK